MGIDDDTGRIAIAYQRRLLEVRDADGLLRFTTLWPNQPIGLGVGRGGENVYVADDGERLSCLQPDGTPQWQVELGSVSRLTVHGSRLYAAGWDGRLRSFDDTGKLRWKLNCTHYLNPENPSPRQASSLPGRLEACPTWQAKREPTTSADVPAGKNLLADGGAKLTVGGTKGWMSEGKVQIRAEDLTNGKTDDVQTPWLHVDELFWDGTAGRQVWAEITFPQPTNVDIADGLRAPAASRVLADRRRGPGLERGAEALGHGRLRRVPPRAGEHLPAGSAQACRSSAICPGAATTATSTPARSKSAARTDAAGRQWPPASTAAGPIRLSGRAAAETITESDASVSSCRWELCGAPIRFAFKRCAPADSLL